MGAVLPAKCESAREIVDYHFRKGPFSSKAGQEAYDEIMPMVDKDPSLQQYILSNRGVLGTNEALYWAAARAVNFSQDQFQKRFPKLFKYGRVLLVSKKFFDTPRIIYQLGFTEPFSNPTMLYGKDATPNRAEFRYAKTWKGEQGMADFDGEYFFENTKSGPYLCRVCIGRGSVYSDTARHILVWEKIENDKFIMERCDAYDVPVGQQRQEKHFTNSSFVEEWHPDGWPKESSVGEAGDQASKTPERVAHDTNSSIPDSTSPTGPKSEDPAPAVEKPNTQEK